MSPVEAPGWFGKIATRGDFVQRRWPAGLARACDEWLSRAMQAGPERLGPQWWPTYLNAPLLRFAWAPGVVGETWWFGVLMASCDDVGRYFPLVVAAPRARPPADAASLRHLDAWHAHLADAATATLAGASLDDFEAALHAAPPWPAHGGGEHPAIDPPATLADDSPATGWWWRPLGHAGTTLRWEAGWPEGERFAELLARASDEVARTACGEAR